MMGIDTNNFKTIYHKFFKCPTFWRIKPAFTCPRCGGKYRCYWDGNDVEGHGKDFCDTCAKALEGKSMIKSRKDKSAKET